MRPGCRSVVPAGGALRAQASKVTAAAGEVVRYDGAGLTPGTGDERGGSGRLGSRVIVLVREVAAELGVAAAPDGMVALPQAVTAHNPIAAAHGRRLTADSSATVAPGLVAVGPGLLAEQVDELAKDGGRGGDGQRL